MIEVDTGHYFTPCSVKAVLIVNNSVLLCLNRRDEWELPGGWPSPTDSTIEDTVKREVLEESGLTVRANQLVDAQLLPTPNDGQVTIVTFKVSLESSTDLMLSEEHVSLRFFDLDALPTSMPSVYRRAILTASD